ncbi:MAG: hypothetical protein KIT27_12340, partial [Legionellales bacterium]|nr:hypothetical protein [Legionellales bacterium]
SVNHAKAHALALHADTNFSAYQTAFNQIHRHIQLGDAFQVVFGRMFIGEFLARIIHVHFYRRRVIFDFLWFYSYHPKQFVSNF